ncbi:MAG: transposase [Planctomycetes bacterium]|nr:transposase [Planctomycetota bacterium]
MVIAYHSIFTTYGTWLPNDPRGSFSKAVYSEELRNLGAIRYGRQSPQPDWPTLSRFRAAASPRLKRPPFYITDETRPLVAQGLGGEVERLGVSVLECSIMNDHVHMVVLRSRFRIEYVVNQLKGAATRALGLAETPWTRGGWNVFLDDEDALRAALEYVRANPAAAGLPPQQWPFVTPIERISFV